MKKDDIIINTMEPRQIDITPVIYVAMMIVIFLLAV